jgi:LPXTG-motif cell wall-anchored protein
VLPATALTQDDIPAPVVLMDGNTPSVATDPTTATSLVVAFAAGEITGQRFDADLVALAPAFTIGADGDVESPSVTWNADDNEWLVVWLDDSTPATAHGRIVALDGTFTTEPFLIADQGLASETFSNTELIHGSYAADQDGYLVAFKANSVAANCESAYVSWVAADGTVPTTAATPVSSDDPSELCNDMDNGADLAYSTDDSEWTVAWWDNATSQTLARRVITGATPTAVGAAFSVGANNEGGSASLAYDSTRNRMLLGWHVSDDEGNNAVGALVSAADVVVPTTLAAGSATADWRKPRLVYVASTDEYFAALHADGGGGVHLVAVDAATGTASAPLLLSTDGVRPSISTDGQCVWVVWQGVGGVSGTTVCTTAEEAPGNAPELAETGAAESASLALAALAIVLLGVGLVALRRRSTTA